MSTWPWLPPPSQGHHHPYWYLQSTQLSHSLYHYPLPVHTHTMDQHSSIPPTRTKCLLGSRHSAECQPCGEQDRPSHSDRCPTPTTHITAHSHTHTQHSVHMACHRHPHRSNNSPIKHTVTGIYRRSSIYLRAPYVAPQEPSSHHH